MKQTIRIAWCAMIILVPLGLGGCDSLAGALGMERVVPDEKAVTTNQPLSIPPDYNLKPPRESPKGKDEDSDATKAEPLQPSTPPNGTRPPVSGGPVTVP